MAHRKVTAYTTYTGTLSNNPVEEAKLNNLTSALNNSAPYKPDIVKLIYAALGWQNKATRDSLTKSPYSVDWSAHSQTTWNVTLIAQSGYDPYASASVTGTVLTFSATDIPWSLLYGLELNGTTNVAQTLSDVETFFSTDTWFTDEQHKKMLNILRRRLPVNMGGSYAYDGDWPMFYPYWGQNASGSVSVYVPRSVTIQFRHRDSGGNWETHTISETLISSTPALYTYTGLPASITGNFPSTSEITNILGTVYMYAKCYDFIELFNGYLELCGEFGKADRASGFTFIKLDASSPYSVSPSDYAECWWDEYDMSPVGSVYFSWKEANGKNQVDQNTAEYNFGDGFSVYDMSGNSCLTAMDNTDYNSMVTLFDSLFVPEVGNVGFTPIDLTMRGLPWIEAGDALQITAEDGTVVNSFALRIEMSGIQHLTATITAEGGDIIEEVV